MFKASCHKNHKRIATFLLKWYHRIFGFLYLLKEFGLISVNICLTKNLKKKSCKLNEKQTSVFKNSSSNVSQIKLLLVPDLTFFCTF